jgi:hypothetical protein
MSPNLYVIARPNGTGKTTFAREFLPNYAECEKRISRNGEAYVLGLLNRQNSFRLLEILKNTTAMKVEPTVQVFSAADAGINTEALSYFALSIVWRGSVHEWKTVEGQTTGITLGPYQESIRQYLAGESGFPWAVLVSVTVCTDVSSHGMIFSPERIKGVSAHYSDISFLTRGLWFHVYVRKDIPAVLREICCVNPPKKIILLRSCEEEFFEASRFLLKDLKVSANLAPM